METKHPEGRDTGGRSLAKPGGPGPETDETTKAARLAERMGRIRNKIFVLSGKGGVGKSTVAVNLAVALALAGKEVGLLDVDFHGPSIPKLLKMEDRRAEVAGGTILPVPFDDRLKVISIGFMLTGRDDAVIWRGPMKMQVIRQFLEDVAWGTLDYLVIDSPPGTGDEPLSVAQLIPDVTGAIVVTTPQELSLADVRRCIGFCRRLNLPVLGVIENMSGFVCPNCGERVDIFKTGGGEAMARSAGVPFLGRIPFGASRRDDQGVSTDRPADHRAGHTARGAGLIEEGERRDANRTADGKRPPGHALRTLPGVCLCGRGPPDQGHHREKQRSGPVAPAGTPAAVARRARGKCDHRRRNGQPGTEPVRPAEHPGGCRRPLA